MTTNTIRFYVLISLIKLSHTFNETEASSIICFYSRSKIVDFLLSKNKTWTLNLSKTLFKECGIRIWSHLDNIEVRNDFVAFPQNKKEISTLSKIIENNFLKFGVIFIDDMNLMNEAPTKINEEIMFINSKSLYVYEHYTINDHKSRTFLGYFKGFPLKYKAIVKESFLNRRNDFYGYNLKAMTENVGHWIQVNLSSQMVQYDSKSNTYDVTYSTKGTFLLKDQFF